MQFGQALVDHHTESAPGHRRDDQQRIAILKLGRQPVAGANVAFAHEQVHVRPYLSAASQDAQARLGILAPKFVQRLGDGVGFDGDSCTPPASGRSASGSSILIISMSLWSP